MNRILGFFKQKITEVKQQNKQQLQALASALTQSEYSTQRVLSLLQGMKSNYMNWNILIANEASTGLYFSQVHNKNICLKKVKGNKELRRQMDRTKVKLGYIREMQREVAEIGALGGKWMGNVNGEIQGINQYLSYVEEERKKARGEAEGHAQKQEKVNMEQNTERVEEIQSDQA